MCGTLISPNEDKAVSMPTSIPTIKTTSIPLVITTAANATNEAAMYTHTPEPTPTSGATLTPEPKVIDIVFSTGITDDGRPSQIVTQLPSGTEGFYAFWYFAHISKDLTWYIAWLYEGERVLVLPGVADNIASGSRCSGIYSTDSNPMLDGLYTFQIYVERTLLAEKVISIGEEISLAPDLTETPVPTLSVSPTFTKTPIPTTTALPIVEPTVKPVQVRCGAMCKDGTRSNATGRGACSSHGGVDYWLYCDQ